VLEVLNSQDPCLPVSSLGMQFPPHFGTGRPKLNQNCQFGSRMAALVLTALLSLDPTIHRSPVRHEIVRFKASTSSPFSELSKYSRDRSWLSTMTSESGFCAVHVNQRNLTFLGPLVMFSAVVKSNNCSAHYLPYISRRASDIMP
jgi:hypothetical protein